MAHFLENCIPPLRSHPVWEFQGMGDHTRLFLGNSVVDPGALKMLVNELYNDTRDLEGLMPSITPLYADENLDAIIVLVPKCNEWGILPRE